MRTNALDCCARHREITLPGLFPWYSPAIVRRLGLTSTTAYNFLCRPQRHIECGASISEAVDLAAECAGKEMTDLCIAARAWLSAEAEKIFHPDGNSGNP